MKQPAEIMFALQEVGHFGNLSFSAVGAVSLSSS